MIDPNTLGTGAAQATKGASQPGAAANPLLDQEPGWKKDFREALSQIRDGGFSAYAQRIRDQKLQEMRKKILQEMGLSEEDLQKMPAEQRSAIEKLVAQQMQERLAAERSLDGSADGQQQNAGQTQIQAARDRFSTGMILLQAMAQNDLARQDLPGNGQEVPPPDGPPPQAQADAGAAKSVDRDQRTL